MKGARSETARWEGKGGSRDFYTCGTSGGGQAEEKGREE